MFNKYSFIKITVFFLLFQIHSTVNAQWQVVLEWGCGAHRVTSLQKHYSNIFSGTWIGEINLSSNNGTTWYNRAPGGNISGIIYSFASIDSVLFFGGYNGLFKTTNLGISWDSVNRSFRIKALFAKNGDFYAAFDYPNQGVYKSTNLGINWIPLQNGMSNLGVRALGCNEQYLFAGTSAGANSGFYRSSNWGLNWQYFSSGAGNNIEFMKVNNNVIFTATGDGIYRSTNNGVNWLNVLDQNNARTVEIYNQNIFACTELNGVNYSSNNGETWTSVNEGLIDWDIYSLLIHNGYIFVGGMNYIMRRPLSEVLTKIKINTEIPKEFKLYQNYPNPFNPSTIIRFSIPENGILKIKNDIITLKVYNILGKEIATLVNEKLQAGMYEVKFEGTNLPSGVYYYRVETKNYSETKKMLLIK